MKAPPTPPKEGLEGISKYGKTTFNINYQIPPLWGG